MNAEVGVIFKGLAVGSGDKELEPTILKFKCLRWRVLPKDLPASLSQSLESCADLKSEAVVTRMAISFPKPPLLLPGCSGGSGVIQNRNQKILVPVE